MHSLWILFWVLRSGMLLLPPLPNSLFNNHPSSSWLDETPASRIITRCTQDIASIDGWLSVMLSSVVSLSISMIVKLGGPVFFSPIFLIPGVFIAVLGMYLGNIYLKAQMSVKREMRYGYPCFRTIEVLRLFCNSNARAPVLAHFGAAITGLGKHCLFFYVSVMAISCAHHQSPSAHTALKKPSKRNL